MQSEWNRYLDISNVFIKTLNPKPSKLAILSSLNDTALQKAIFWPLFLFLPAETAQWQMPFMTVKTADSDLENQNILILDEKLRSKTGVQKGRPTTVRGL